MDILSIIPARGGSKSIPLKNIQLVAGKPLIAWTIESALRCPLLSKIVVSTDDLQIANIALDSGAEVPFLRPPELAQDNTPGIDPILHAIRWLDEHDGYRPDYVMVLQPTSPLRETQDIEAAIQLAIKKQADSIVSVSQVAHHPYWTKTVLADGRLTDFLSLDHAYVRRQDLPPVYALNGAIYLARRDVLLERQTWYTDHTYAYIMPPERSLDIDTPWDLYLADSILKDRRLHEND